MEKLQSLNSSMFTPMSPKKKWELLMEVFFGGEKRLETQECFYVEVTCSDSALADCAEARCYEEYTQ